MRICRIDNVPNDATPGGGLFPYYLAKYIPEPTLYITRATNGVRPLPPHVEVAKVFRDRTTPSGLREEIFDTKKKPFVSRLWVQVLLAVRLIQNDSSLLFTVMRRMAQFHPDLVICGSIKRLVYGILAKYLLGSKLVLSLHNTTETAALRNLGLLRLLIKIPDRIIVVSRNIERQLRGFVPPERIRLSSTGVDLDECVNHHLPRKDQIVTIGSFKWKKGYKYLLEAASIVFSRYPHYRLLIVGDGEERREIENDIDRLGLKGRVVLAGILGRAEVVRLLNDSKLFVLASLYEGLPKALLEALACGTPAVVTDGCNAEGIIDTTGLSVPSGDPEALAKAIVTMLEDGGLWEKCAKNAPEVAKSYDWKAVAARDYAVYRELVRQ